MADRPTPLTLDPETIARKHANALAELIEGEVRFSKHDRMLYATDASIYQVEPLGVVIPRTAEDVRKAIAYCAEHKLPILPRGGGTSLAGQCTGRAVVIDTSVHLTRVLDVNAERRTCRVEAGITLADLNAQLKPHGLHFAPDPSTIRQANIGGCIGNNAAGTRSVKYGRTSENVVGIAGYLADSTFISSDRRMGRRNEVFAKSGYRIENRGLTAGKLFNKLELVVEDYEKLIRTRFPMTLRRNAGYALDSILKQVDDDRGVKDSFYSAPWDKFKGDDPPRNRSLVDLICGSEGTLVFVTEATLKLHPIPKATGLAVIGFDTLDEAIDAVVPCLGTDPSAVELLDDMIITLARKNDLYAPCVARMPQPGSGVLGAVLYVEYQSDEGEAEIARKFDELRTLIEDRRPSAGFSAHLDAKEIAEALELRRAGEPLLHAIPGARKPLGFVEDNAVPPEKLAEFVRRFRAIIERQGTKAAFWAHASVGVLHVRPLLDLGDDADLARMETIAVEAADLARELGGVMSGEHGDGKARGPLLERHFGPELMEAFRKVKELFDPHYLLNPGNIVPLPGDDPPAIETIHQRTRKRPDKSELPHASVETYFDYESEGGYEHAMELCNGAGVCRKSKEASSGAMCPSFMATRDERHSTRGRGNALRLAITGQLDGGAPAWNDAQTMDTLDLCLSCKACKSECPSNVDVARYKAEYVAQSRIHGKKRTVEDYLLTHIRSINRFGSMTAPLANFVNALPPAKWLIRTTLGYAKGRSLPRFSKSLMARARGESANVGLPEGAKEVLLFGDCFTSFNESDIGMDAIRVLNAFGYRVRVLDVGCCGRTMISNGLLAEAVETIAKTVRAIEGDAPVVVLEPSCLSAIKDDWLALKLPEDARDGARAFADRCAMLEQFLDEHWDDHPKRPEFATPPGRVAVHPHCHQRALWGADSTTSLLVRLFGETHVNALDTTCCGMAGSFGFAARRHELSMRIGELSVFPAARELGSGDALLATGTSCRHQIHDGTEREAVHPATYLASFLA